MRNNVVSIDRSRGQRKPVGKSDRIARLGVRIDRDWSIRQFDDHADQAMRLGNTQPLARFDALLHGPATEMDAVPEPQPARHVHRDVVLWLTGGAFLAGSLVTILTLAAMLR